jgi:hypothetical protein
MEALNTFKSYEESYKTRFFFYDLAEPDKLVYHFERQES